MGDAVVHQHDARDTPSHEHQADDDAEPAVRIDQQLAPIEEVADMHPDSEGL
jgi:hypothetical protein